MTIFVPSSIFLALVKTSVTKQIDFAVASSGTSV